MHKLVPDFIISCHQQGQLTGSLQAGIISVDIKGISALTQALMSRSHTGVEVLTDTVNAIFSPAIDAIESLGGFISGFAGDAFTALFPASEAVGNPGFSNSDLLSAAIRIRDSVITQGKQITEFGDFELEVRIGVALGDVQWSIVETGDQTVYWFCGAGIQKAVLAQEIARINEVIVEKDLCKYLNIEVCQSPLRDDKFCCLEQLYPLAEPRALVQTPLSMDSFVPKEILDLSSEGEFRILLSSFINLSDPQSDQVIALLQTAHKLGGYLSHIDCTDKGWVAYVMFGAPLGYEKLSLRAMDFALEMQNICGRNARIGLSQGKAFTGFIGSRSRAEYTGMGMAVNLAARFMANAEWGDVCLDETIRKELSSVIATESLGEKKFKGFPHPISAFRFLYKHQDRMPLTYQNKFVGRTEELDTLSTSCLPLLEGRFAGVCHIYGEAGQGKSRLAYELIRILGDKVQCFELQTDSIQKNALNPFSYWLRQQFTSLQTISIVERRNEFRSSWAEFLAKIRNVPNTERIISELERVESILAGLIGLEWEGSIYSNLDSKYRPTATGFALKALLEAFGLLKPMLLIIEDIHWLDKESEEVISILTRRASSIPYKLILTARPFDDGKLPTLDFDKDISVQNIYLNGLSPGQIETVINSLLPQNATASNPVTAAAEFTEYVHAIAQGNPFIVEQLTRYLIETDQLLVKDNLCFINAQTDALPSGVQAILVARLDRLEAELKHTVQTASILGREFTVDILGEMLKTLENRPDYLNEIVVRSQLYAGEQEHIWNSLSEINYIFSHSLLREAAYAMQLKRQIMQLHLLAAEVMEKHYAKDNSKLIEIATHFFNAGENLKAVQYFDLCSAYEHRKGNYLDAIKWSRKSLELKPDNYGALVQLIKSLDGADLRLEAREIAVKKLEELEKAGLNTDRKTHEMLNLVVTTFNSEFESQEMEHWVFRLWELTKQLFPEQSAEMLSVYNFLGSLHMEKQMYEESEKYFLKAMDAMEICTGEALQEANITLNNLGLLYCHLQRYQEALPLLERAIQVHDDEFGEGHPGAIYNRINHARALFSSGEHEQALQKYLKIKELIIEKVGKDHDMYFKAMQHLSGIYSELGKFAEAEHILRDNLELQIARKDDRTFEVAVLLRGLGQVLNRLSKIDEAEANFRKSVEIFKEVAPPESVQAIMARYCLAQINIKRGNYAEALSELLDLIEITHKVGSDPYGLLESFQDFVIRIYIKQENWDEAEKFLSNVLSQYKGEAVNSSAYEKFMAKHEEVLKNLVR